MATVKIKFNNSAYETLYYALTHGMDDDHKSASGCEPEPVSAAKAFANVWDIHSSHEDNEAIHIIQSFTEEESRKYSPSLFQDVGSELVQKYFPGHQFVCVTHTDTEKHHNHIVVNPVNFETGKRINSKFKHLHELRKVNDSICLEKGLSIPNRDATERAGKMPEKVKNMTRYGKFSQLVDLKQKADFAKSYATSYDEYKGILSEFSINVRIEKENITYLYPGAKRGKRGKNLGRYYDKEGLEKRFKANDETFKDKWHIRDEIRGKIDAFKQASPAQQIEKKDYSKFTSAPRRQAHLVTLSDEVLKRCMVPIDEIAKAKRANILEYCERNKIALEKNSKGKLALRGRDYVEIDTFEWKNTKNNTRGSLIDLVAFHKNVSYLDAISQINDNPRLLLLEQNFEKQKPVYKTFYIPKQDRMDGAGAKAKWGHVAGQNGFHKKTADALFKAGLVHVSKEGVIRLFPKDDASVTFEFNENENGERAKTKRGNVKVPFFSLPRKSAKARVFLDPFSFGALDHSRHILGQEKNASILALFEPNFEAVDHFVAVNKHQFFLGFRL